MKSLVIGEMKNSKRDSCRAAQNFFSVAYLWAESVANQRNSVATETPPRKNSVIAIDVGGWSERCCADGSTNDLGERRWEFYSAHRKSDACVACIAQLTGKNYTLSLSRWAPLHDASLCSVTYCVSRGLVPQWFPGDRQAR